MPDTPQMAAFQIRILWGVLGGFVTFSALAAGAIWYMGGLSARIHAIENREVLAALAEIQSEVRADQQELKVGQITIIVDWLKREVKIIRRQLDDIEREEEELK